MNDCKILFEFINKFNEFVINIFNDYYNKDSWALSRSSISSINKNYIFYKNINIINTPLQASIFSESYFGGRNECFYIGEKNGLIKAIDINSSYPFEMLKGFAGEYLYENNNIPEVKIESIRWLGLVELSYKNKYLIPPLCVKQDHKLIFPNIMNKKLMFIWDCEYYTIKDDLNIHLIKNIYYFKEINLKELIEKLFKLKQDNKDNKALYNSIKVIINSMYGVLGMNNYRKQKMIIKDLSSLKLHYDEYETSEAFEGLKWLYYSELCNIQSAFQCASSITSQARLHLWNKMNEINKSNNQVLYCDTDSIYYLSNNYINEISNEIGKWDENTYKYIKIITCKVYSTIDYNNKNKIVFKGLHDNNIDMNDIIKNCSFKDKSWKILKDLKISNTNIIKKFGLEYNKGIVIENGIVKPFII